MKIKHLLVALTIFLLTKATVVEVFDKRPIKFHLYKSYEAFEDYIFAKFPVGSDFGDALKLLQRSGANCYLSTNKTTIYYDILKNARFIATCLYHEEFISVRPFMQYDVRIQADENLHIIKAYGARTKNYQLWW